MTVHFCPRCRSLIRPGDLLTAIEVCGDALRRLDADVTKGPEHQLPDWSTLSVLERRRWCRKAEHAMDHTGERDS